MTNTGAGVARIDGVVIFVNGGVDGDVAEIRIIKVYSGYCAAKIERLISPSPHRVKSGCEISGRCGACAFRCVSYEHELEIKRRYVETSFRKQGLDIEVEAVANTGFTDRWRTKAQIPYLAETGEAGYYAYHSNTIIPCPRCLLHADDFNEITAFICSFLHKNGIAGVRHIYLRRGETTLTACVVTEKRGGPWNALSDELRARFPQITGFMLNINSSPGNVILGTKFVTIWGEPSIDASLCGMTLKISPDAFYQINRPAAEIAFARLHESANVREGDTVLDLFCGIGTIGLYFAKKTNGIRLIGADTTESAVRDAQQNAESNGIAGAEFICIDAAKLDIARFGADVIIVDPPRGGLAPELCGAIAAASPRAVAYMSCDSGTLARDCKRFAQHGYFAGNVTPADLFPRTGHVEAIALLSKLNTK